MIINFADKTTEDIYNGLDSKPARKIPMVIWSIAQRKLDMIDAATEIKDLKIPPANRLEKLKGLLAGYYSIRINDQYRIIFKWINSAAENVKITDYH
ncbi:MAG: type II toxin-antitoxin system RelE/ParE family toxin [Ignavibacteria bacterium]|nr:type II toxin-antitoxin system RelE/ParE family toxin [Ignavibacteria bacterium]